MRLINWKIIVLLWEYAAKRLGIRNLLGVQKQDETAPALEELNAVREKVVAMLEPLVQKSQKRKQQEKSL